MARFFDISLGGLGDDREVVEEDLRVDAKDLVVAVDCGPLSELAPKFGAADAGDDRTDNLVSLNKQGDGGAGRVRCGSGGRVGLGDQLVCALEFTQS